jgi:transketolase
VHRYDNQSALAFNDPASSTAGFCGVVEVLRQASCIQSFSVDAGSGCVVVTAARRVNLLIEGHKDRMTDIDQLSIDTIRTLAIDTVQKASSGHPGTPMGLAPVAYTIWQYYLRYDPAEPLWPNRDRFILSPGHASVLLYALLHLTKVRAVSANDDVLASFAVSIEDLQNFRQLGSRTPGHPEYRHTSGIEATTGPLGQGVAMSVGLAIGEKWLAAHYNRPEGMVVDFNVYALCSDGEMMEGVASEAASLAGHQKLDNLCWIYDSNTVTLDGPASWTFSEDVATRFLAYGWNVLAVRDGNNITEVRAALDGFALERSRPTLIIVNTHIGYGSPNKQDSHTSHGEPLGADEVRLTKRSYGWPEDAQFLVPDEVYEHFASGFGRRGKTLRSTWDEEFQIYKESLKDLAAQFAAMGRRLTPALAEAAIPQFPADAKGMATRDSSGKVQNAIAQQFPWLIGGSADLDTSTKTRLIFDGAASFSPSNRAGRNLHFGVREHAMGAIANGLSLAKIRPYASTFLIFSDYLRPTMRLAALMGVPTIFIFTHDSISVGEDGPTHQPVEQLASLRAIPNFTTIRPGDANEVAEAWRTIIHLNCEPAALILSRQMLPTIDRARYASASGVAQGAYILADPEGGAIPEIILIATGSELSLAVEAFEIMSGEGIAVRVVSMPSWNIFEKQDREYHDYVLPTRVAARVAIERGVVMGWDRYVGRDGAIIGMHSFGASAPSSALASKFGFTSEGVVAAAKQQLAHQGR